jgi:hypothetical protein
MNRVSKRLLTPIDSSAASIKQQAHFTPIIELKPIIGGSSTTKDDVRLESSTKKVTKIISTNHIQKDFQRSNTIVSSI